MGSIASRLDESPRSGAIRIAIFDSHMAVAESLAVALSAKHGIETVGITSDVDALIGVLQEERPDIVVAETHVADEPAGLSLLDDLRVKAANVPVVFLSGNDRPSLSVVAQRGDAAGYLLKSTPLSIIAHSLRDVAAGATIYDSRLRGNGQQPLAQPSRRELELLSSLASGQTNTEIAYELSISTRTVESHLRRLFKRYHVSCRAQLLMVAIDEGWVRTQERRHSVGRQSAL